MSSVDPLATAQQLGRAVDGLDEAATIIVSLLNCHVRLERCGAYDDGLRFVKRYAPELRSALEQRVRDDLDALPMAHDHNGDDDV